MLLMCRDVESILNNLLPRKKKEAYQWAIPHRSASGYTTGLQCINTAELVGWWENITFTVKLWWHYKPCSRNMLHSILPFLLSCANLLYKSYQNSLWRLIAHWLAVKNEGTHCTMRPEQTTLFLGGAQLWTQLWSMLSININTVLLLLHLLSRVLLTRQTKRFIYKQKHYWDDGMWPTRILLNESWQALLCRAVLIIRRTPSTFSSVHVHRDFLYWSKPEHSSLI